MAIDWNYLFDVKVEELSDERVESLYEQLIQFEPKNEDNIQRLRKLLELSQSVLQIKSVQTEVAIEEMREIAKKYDKNENELLREELDIFKKSDLKGENIAIKLSEANDMIFELKNIIESKESENIKMKRKFNELQNSLDLKEREVIALRSEVDSLKDEFDNQRQVSDNINEKQESLEKLKEKNQQIQTLLDELRDAEIVNLEVTNQCKKLKLELKSATNELQISCNQMEMLSKQINELKQLNEDFLSEKQFLMEEIDKLKQTLSKYENGDQTVIDKYVENLKNLQNLVQLKDEEIIKLKTLSLIPDEEVKETQKRLSKELEERDRQIELLKSQLNEAVVDMENQTEIIRKLYQQNREDKEISKLNDKIVVLSNQLKTIEEEVLAKDEEILSLRKRINTYERGEYGLKDALKEVNDLTKHLNNRDQRIEEMVQQMNRLKEELNVAEDAIDGIHINKQTDEQTDIQTDRQISEERRIGNKREKIKILEMERKLLELEDEKFALTERLKLSLNKSFVDKRQEYKEIEDLKEKLKSFERENLDLHLGMKEILNGFRETDSQSDVIIECPTLERLCKLLESRSISSDLTNIIALKAELDLVRGHNEQLRTDMRSMRSDYLKVISQYTEDLLENDFIFDDSTEKIRQQNGFENIQNSIYAYNEKSEVIPISDTTDVFDKEEPQTDINEEENAISYPKIIADKETQTLLISDNNERIKQIIVDQMDVFTQTETITQTITETNVNEIISKNLCENCPKMIKIVNFLKNCVEKLELNIKSSENKYLQRLELLQNENRNLIQNLNKKLNEKDIQINENESQISFLQNKLSSNELKTDSSSQQTFIRDDFKAVANYSALNKSQFNSDSKTELSSSCKTVLESVINCLQARIEHKDESIRQYRNMLSEAKQNFENEMIRLIENIRENERQNSINFTQMIDNEELESALKSCVNELELCKSELNSRISQLENELEAKSAKLMAYQKENEELRLKRTTPTTQLKQTIEQLREESKQKDSIINSLSKTIKDDRSMRAVSAVRRSKDDSMSREKKIDNELFQEIANLRSVIETQKKTITNLEVVKWDLEKNIKDIKEQMKTKLKDRDNEINHLKERLEKIKIRLNKNENEKQILQNKVLKRENIQKNDKSSQICPKNSGNDSNKLKEELKKLQKDLKQRENNSNVLRQQLEISREIESELKTLLQESVKREKLATIHEESTQMDQQLDELLQENARIKVELRMAEFELKKRINN